MRFYFTAIYILFSNTLAFSQPFVADQKGYVRDTSFHKLIRQRNYQLVSAFDTIQTDSSQLILATIIKGNKILNLDLKGNEIPYYDENYYQIKRREKLLYRDFQALEKRANYLKVYSDKRYKTFQKDDKYGLMSKDGVKIIVEPKFEGVWAYDGLGLISIKKDRKVGIIDTLGTVLIKPEYDFLIPCLEDTSKVKFFIGYKNNLTTLVNLRGKELFPPKYSMITPFVLNGLLFTTVFNEQRSAVRGILDKDGRIVLEPKYAEYLRIPNTNLIRTELTNSSKFGLINTSGKPLLDVSYDFIDISGSENFIMIQKGRKTGYIDKTGKIVVEPVYEKAVRTSDDNVFIVGIPSVGASMPWHIKWGVVNTSGRQVISCIYDELFGFGSFYIGKKGESYYKISSEGKEIKRYDFQSMKPSRHNLFIVQNSDGDFGLLDVNERVVIPFEFKELEASGKNYFFTSKGIIDLDNNLIIPRKWHRTTWTNNLALRKNGIFIVEGGQFPRQILCIDRYNNIYDQKQLEK